MMSSQRSHVLNKCWIVQRLNPELFSYICFKIYSMKNKLTIALAPLLLIILNNEVINAQAKKPNVENKLKDLGIHLSVPAPPTANFLKAVRIGNLVYLSGHGPDKPEGGQVIGKLGSDLTIEQGQQAARLVGISLLSSLKAEIKDLNKVKRIVKVLGMVNAIPSFERHSQVMNGFSDLMVEVFGENGKHARSSVGVGSLPANIAVEIEMIVEVRN